MSECVKVSGVLNPYDILIGKGIVSELGDILKNTVKAQTLVIITDDNVDKLYAEKVEKILKNSGFNVLKFVFCHGEKYKTMETVSDILEFMAENNVTRGDCIVALGGGITGDISGFCAASYLRGIDFVQVPTTFLAAIDSSVGGKTGVNLKSGKNLAGAFYQPRIVLCDTEFFNTLPEENFKEGVAEAIKYGIICNRGLFDILAYNKDWNLEEVIKLCVTIKAEIVAIDEFDTGKRQLLNLGHTIGHAIEKCTDFEITHGIAVGIGMAMISKVSDRLLWSCENTYDTITEALKNNGLLYECDVKNEDLLNVMMRDKKRNGDTITLVVPEKIGKSVLKKIQVEELFKVMEN